MADRSKYRRIPELYTTGTELRLDDDTVMWLQVLNDHEMGEARHDAAVARSRLILALKEFGSDERTKLRGSFLDGGTERAIERLINAQATEMTLKLIDAIRQDPDWKERLDVLERSDELLSRPEDDPERKILAKIDTEYAIELAERLDTERGYLQTRYGGMSEDDLYAEYEELYINRRGGDAGFEEFQITEIWYAARVCDGVRKPDGSYDHSGCEGHRMRVFETREEVRALPDRLVLAIRETLNALSMTDTEAKNSDSSRGSSASSRLPNEEEASTASTPTVIPDAPPGTSSAPSPMLSPS